MIGLAPTDFWQKVIERLAQLIFERETRIGVVPEAIRAVALPVRPASEKVTNE